jgi:drug/metabolite transporter (DMT)-like permease
VIVALASRRAGERPSRLQMGGIAGLVAGAALYFGPFEVGPTALLGLAIAVVGLAANSVAALLGRSLARDSIEAVGGVLGLTAVSMAVGSAVLLSVGLAVEGLPRLTFEAWLIIGWLALVNTALAFTLWNHTLRTLTAVESSVVNNMMLIQIAILAWVFLGEALTAVEMLGLALALAGILAVQLAPLRGTRTARAAGVTADETGTAWRETER